MRAPAIGAVFVLLLALGIAPAMAQDARMTSPAELEATVVEHADELEQDRARLRALLERPEVRDVGRRHGIDMKRVDDAAATLPAAAMQRMAPHMRMVEARLMQDRITLSTTTLIIILLLVILIVLIAS